jgi:hypothetical protein
LDGFESPFTWSLKSNIRWVVLAQTIPWDDLASVYQSQMDNGSTGVS